MRQFKNYEKLSPALFYGCFVGLRGFRFYLFSCSRMHIQHSQRSKFHHIFSPFTPIVGICCRYRSSSFSTAPHIFQVICPNECILNISFVSLISFKCTTIFFPPCTSSIERGWPTTRQRASSSSAQAELTYLCTRAQSRSNLLRSICAL